MRREYEIDAATGCWNWLGQTLRGYPIISRRKNVEEQRAHRYYYAERFGPITPDTHIHHRCENTRCVNPDHLEAVPEREHFKHHFLDERGLTFEDILAIREKGRDHRNSADDVAAEYGISRFTVRRYWWGVSWIPELGELGRIDPDPWPCAAPGCKRLVQGKRDKRYCSQDCKASESHKRKIARARAARAQERRAA